MTSYLGSHEMNPARLTLEETEKGFYSGSWMFPANAAGLPAEVSFTDCEALHRPRSPGERLDTESRNCG